MLVLEFGLRGEMDFGEGKAPPRSKRVKHLSQRVGELCNPIKKHGVSMGEALRDLLLDLSSSGYIDHFPLQQTSTE